MELNKLAAACCDSSVQRGKHSQKFSNLGNTVECGERSRLIRHDTYVHLCAARRIASCIADEKCLYRLVSCWTVVEDITSGSRTRRDLRWR